MTLRPLYYPLLRALDLDDLNSNPREYNYSWEFRHDYDQVEIPLKSRRSGHDQDQHEEPVIADYESKNTTIVGSSSSASEFESGSTSFPDTIIRIHDHPAVPGLLESERPLGGTGILVVVYVLSAVVILIELFLRYTRTSDSHAKSSTGDVTTPPKASIPTNNIINKTTVLPGESKPLRHGLRWPTLIDTSKRSVSRINTFLDALLNLDQNHTDLINQPDTTTGVTPLELAAFIGSHRIVEGLLLRGANICDTPAAFPDSSYSHDSNINSPRGIAPIWWALKGMHDRRAVVNNNEAGALELLKLLISHQADIHSIPLRNPPNTRSAPLPPLHIACRLGSVQIVNLLVETDRARTVNTSLNSTLVPRKFIIPHLRDHTEHSSAVHIAAKHNQLPILKVLLHQTPLNIESRDKHGNTPLRIASREGNTSVVEYLLDKHHADIESRDETGSTPLLCAVKYREKQVLQALLARGADVCARDTLKGHLGLHVAAVQGHADILKVLLARHQDDEEMDIERKLDLTGHLESTDSDGKTALHLACEHGHVDISRELLSTHPSPETYIRMTDNQGYTPLHYACMQTTASSSHSSRRADLLHLLLPFNPLINAISTTEKTTPLHHACAGPPLPILGNPRGGEPEIVKLLLLNGADVEAQDSEGKRPVHWAVPMRFLRLEDEFSGAVVGLLKELGGADLYARNGKGVTARELAVEEGYVEVLKVLGE